PIALRRELEFLVIDPEPGAGNRRRYFHSRRNALLDLLERCGGLIKRNSEWIDFRDALLVVFRQPWMRYVIHHIVRLRTVEVEHNRESDNHDRGRQSVYAPAIGCEVLLPFSNLSARPFDPGRRLPLPLAQ